MIFTRLATEEDIPRIIEIENEAISPPWTHGSLLNEIYNDDSFCVIAVEAAEKAEEETARPDILGFAILRQVGDDAELLQIAVDRLARRGGVGNKLMEAVLDYAAEKGYLKVFLEVRCTNKAAVFLYKKHWFKSVRIRKGYYTDPIEDAYIMAREINV